MKDLGLACLLPEFVNGLFFRNALNYAFPTLEIADVRAAFEEFEAGRVTNMRTGNVLCGPAWPELGLELLRVGGLAGQLEAGDYLHPRG